MAELLFWPALLAYSEAAVAYLNDVRHPGLAGQLATWGVRVGWLVQTALLAVQATRANGFPWSTWGGSLNLFVWLVVGAYLIWGCQPRYRLLGLAVLPLAVLLFILFVLSGAGLVLARDPKPVPKPTYDCPIAAIPDAGVLKKNMPLPRLRYRACISFS